MLNTLKTRATYANIASTIALVIAVGGGGAAVAAGMVGSDKIINGAVRTVDLHSGAVTGPKIRKGAVTGPKIRTNAVSGPKIRDGAIDDPRLFGNGNLGVVRAYAWNKWPDVSSTLTTDVATSPWAYNRSGGDITVTHNKTGDYDVDFAGLNLQGGQIIASAYGMDATSCKVATWFADTAKVLCFNANGAPNNSMWTITVID